MASPTPSSVSKRGRKMDSLLPPVAANNMLLVPLRKRKQLGSNAAGHTIPATSGCVQTNAVGTGLSVHILLGYYGG